MKKKNYKQYFEDKNITVMGLGLLGRGLNVTKFLAKCGANLTVTDLKDEDELKPSLKELEKYDNIEYVLGRHRLSEFEDADMVIKAPGVPKDSKYIKRAKENDIPVEMDASLFQRIVEERYGRGDVTFIGITGTRGKSTTTHLIHDIIRRARKTVHIGGNVRGMATLPLLKKVEKGDFVVLELDSWQLQGYGESKIGPNIAVFTNFMEDHSDYYKSMKQYFSDKAEIFDNQYHGDFLVLGVSAFETIRKYRDEDTGDIRSTVAVAKPSIVPDTWSIKLLGEHNRELVAIAIQVAQLLDIDMDVIQRSVENFSGLEGRLQYVRKINRRSIYNDNNSTTPDATVAGIDALLESKDTEDVVLICGGSDKGLDTDKLEQAIARHVKFTVLVPGSGTDELRFKLYGNEAVEVDDADTVKEALETALEHSSPGDAILFSPGFASFGSFSNEYERNDAFVEAIEDLK